MSKKKKQLLDVVPKATLHFSADDRVDLEALAILAAYYHSHNRMDKCQAIIDNTDAFDKYIKAKEEIEKA